MGERSRVPVTLVAAGDTHIGGRSHNEDAILLRPDLNLYVVADGAGGQNAGNVAASLATTSIAHFFEQTKKGAQVMPEFDSLGLPTAARRLSAAVQEANKEIITIAKSSKRHRGMGTTVVAAFFASEHRTLHIAYVGDSRCYRLREGRLELLTHDHSLANDVLELRPDAEDARIKALPQNVITRALGMSNDMRVSLRSHELSHGDRYVLCSDGLSDVVDRLQITEALDLEAGAEERVRLLVDMAIEAGADDNVAVIVIDCTFGSAQATTSRPIRKHTPPSMPMIEGPPRVRLRAKLDSLTEESVPEIVLYEEPDDRESTPMIHVVPMESASQAIADAVAPIIGPEGAPRARSVPPPDSQPPPIVLPPEARLPSRAGLYAHHGDEEDRPTVDYIPVELGGAAKISAPRRHKPDVAVTVDAPGRTGNTKHPPSPSPHEEMVGDIKAPRPHDEPPPAKKSAPRSTPGPAQFYPSRQPVPRPPPPSTRPGLGSGRPATSASALPTRTTKPGPVPPKPPSKITIEPKPMPAPRSLMVTNDYVGEETLPCPACGSIISRTAEYCLYCGATTGHKK